MLAIRAFCLTHNFIPFVSIQDVLATLSQELKRLRFILESKAPAWVQFLVASAPFADVCSKGVFFAIPRCFGRGA
jgi:hypothetical protein